MTAWKEECAKNANLKKEYTNMLGELKDMMIHWNTLKLQYQTIKFGNKGDGLLQGVQMVTDNNKNAGKIIIEF